MWRALSPLLITLLLIGPLVASAEIAATFVVTNNGNSVVTGGSAGNLVMQFDLPAPAADTLLHDGAGYVVAAGDALRNFGANEKYSDSDHDNVDDYSGAELIVNSADNTITSGEVVTPGTAGLLSNWTTGQNVQFADDDHDNAQDYSGLELIVDSADSSVTAGEIINDGIAGLLSFGSAEPNLDIYLDHGTDDNLYTDGEDIFYQEHNGADVYADGASMQAFSANELSFYDDHASNDGDYNDGEAIINDVDNDGFPSSGDVTLTAGKAAVEALTAGDRVCFDGSVVNDTEFDPAEVIWYDDPTTNGDCSVFTTGEDIILVGGAAPINTLTAFGTEQEVAFLDNDNDGSYTCSRAGTCEPIVHYGADTNFSDDDNLPTSTIFMDSSTEGTDGIATTGTGWDESGAAEDLNDFSVAATTFGYISTIAYADGDDIFGMSANGASTVFADGDESRLFAVNDKFSDADNNTFYDAGELIASSADANLSGAEILAPGTVDLDVFAGNFQYSDTDNNTFLTAGELIADSADANLAGAEIVYSGTVDLQAFSANFMYHDGSSDTNYTDGEDIVDDVDASTYYNADQLTSLKVENSGTCLDASLAALGMYEDTDGNNTFDGTETKIGNIAGTPFIGTVVNVSGASSIYTNTGNTQTIFITVDTAASAGTTCTFTGKIPNTGGAPFAAQFLSGDNGPTDTDVVTTDVVTVDDSVPTATVSPANGATGVAVNDNIVVTFSEPMIPGTFTYNVTVSPGGLVVVWSAGNTVATVSHTAFAEGTTYTFMLTGGTDLAGNSIAAFNTSFTTTAPPVAVVSGGSAQFGAPACSGTDCPSIGFARSTDSVNTASSAPSTDTGSSPEQFTDIAGHWAASYIEIARANGYIDGYPDNTFRPDNEINRAEASKQIAIWMMPELNECTESSFSDVSCSEWFGKYVMYLKQMLVIEGYGDGAFRPEASITRAEALKMMLFAKGMTKAMDVSGMDNIYSDVSEGDWFYAVVIKGYSMGIIGTYNDGMFGPNQPITRAEFTELFVKAFLIE